MIKGLMNRVDFYISNHPGALVTSVTLKDSPKNEIIITVSETIGTLGPVVTQFAATLSS
jgi:hypothetical protein